MTLRQAAEAAVKILVEADDHPRIVAALRSALSRLPRLTEARK